MSTEGDFLWISGYFWVLLKLRKGRNSCFKSLSLEAAAIHQKITKTLSAVMDLDLFIFFSELLALPLWLSHSIVLTPHNSVRFPLNWDPQRQMHLYTVTFLLEISVWGRRYECAQSNWFYCDILIFICCFTSLSFMSIIAKFFVKKLLNYLSKYH